MEKNVFEERLHKFEEEFNDLLLNKQIDINAFANKRSGLTVTNITVDAVMVKLTVNKDGIDSNFDLYTLLARGFLSVDGDTLSAVVDVFNNYKNTVSQHNSEEMERRHLEYVTTKAAEKEAQRMKDAQTRYMNAYNSVSDRLERLSSANYISLSDETVEYLRDNITVIHADIPESAQQWFINTFGADAKCHTVPFKLTSGGYPMKFSAAFSANLKNPEDAPKSLQQYIVNKKLNNTELIYTLVKEYDFKFGKQEV